MYPKCQTQDEFWQQDDIGNSVMNMIAVKKP